MPYWFCVHSPSSRTMDCSGSFSASVCKGVSDQTFRLSEPVESAKARSKYGLPPFVVFTARDWSCAATEAISGTSFACSLRLEMEIKLMLRGCVTSA